MADALKNFAYSTVAAGSTVIGSSVGTSLVVAAGQGALFPAAPFNIVVWPANIQPLSTNAEIMRVTAVSTDTFTVTRNAETGGSALSGIAVGYQVDQGISALMITDRLEKSGGTMTGALTNTATTGNTLVWDTNTLVVDATNDRVGIGTATPGNKLSVNSVIGGTLGEVAIGTGGATNIGLVVQGAAAQSVDLQQWQDSSGAIVAAIKKAGNIRLSSAGNPDLDILNEGGTYKIVANWRFIGYGFFGGGNPAAGIALGIRGAAATDISLVLRGFTSQTADLQQWQDTSSNVLAQITASGNFGIGITPTALLHLKAGTATANTAPLKFTSGTLNTTAVAGQHEYNGNHFLTNSTVRFPIGGVLDVNTTAADSPVSSTGDLITYSVTAGVLATNKDFLEIEAAGVFAANANSKTVTMEFGGTTLVTSGASITYNGGAWKIKAKVIRTGAATQIAVATLELTTAALTTTAVTTYSTPAETLSGAITLKCTGTGVGAADVSQKLMVTEYKPAA